MILIMKMAVNGYVRAIDVRLKIDFPSSL